MDGDAGQEAGMGHVYRSLAYAWRIEQAFRGVSIRFFMRDFPEGLAKVREEGYPISVLPVRPNDADWEKALRSVPPKVLIIDTLGSTLGLIAVARQFGCRVVTVDDLEPSAAEADVVVNGILWATRVLPALFGKARVYQGVEYIQLRDQFAEVGAKKRVCSEQVTRILISTGGADGRGFAPQLMAAVSTLSFECSVSVMAGPAYQNHIELENAAKALAGRVKFTIVTNATNMADYMSSAELALITGGTVMFESAACGTPALLACSYEHQVPQAEWFSERGTALNLGYFSADIDRVRITHAIEMLASDRLRRQKMSDAGRATVDGRGLERFVEIVGSVLPLGQPGLCG